MFSKLLKPTSRHLLENSLRVSLSFLHLDLFCFPCLFIPVKIATLPRWTPHSQLVWCILIKPGKLWNSWNIQSKSPNFLLFISLYFSSILRSGAGKHFKATECKTVMVSLVANGFKGKKRFIIDQQIKPHGIENVLLTFLQWDIRKGSHITSTDACFCYYGSLNESRCGCDITWHKNGVLFLNFIWSCRFWTAETENITWRFHSKSYINTADQLF